MIKNNLNKRGLKMEYLKQRAIANMIENDSPYGYAKDGNIEVRVIESFSGRSFKKCFRATWFIDGVQTAKSKIKKESK
jgi:hypothetical protein